MDVMRRLPTGSIDLIITSPPYNLKNLSLIHISRQMMSVLVFLPFFCSMAITNDVALITFVPFAITVLRMAEQEKLLIPCLLYTSRCV